MVDLPGPTFWERVYGYRTFDEFYDSIGRFIPTINIGPGHLAQEAVAGLAYQNPASAPGNFAVGLASAAAAVNMTEADKVRIQAGANTAAQVGGLAGMAQLIIGGVFQVAINAKCGSQDVVNVLGVQNSSGDSAGAANAVRTAWKVASGPLSRLSNIYSLSNFTAVDIGSPNGAIAVVADSATGGVSTSSSLATAGACALVKWNGGTRSRSTRGRLYFGPIMEADINSDGRTLATTPQNQMIVAFNAFRTSLSGSGYPLVVISRKLQQAFPVVSSTVETVIATQRRRIRS